MNFGTQERNLRKAPTDIQPTDTVEVDTTPDDQTLLSRMRPKTRYNIRLAARRGVETRVAPESELPRWYELYEQTMRRKGLTVHDYRYFGELFAAEHDEVAGRPKLYLIMAEKESRPLAGMILAVHDSYAVYLYGASSEHSRRDMASYRLQWRAIEVARSQACRCYDLFGIPSDTHTQHPMHGLLFFKRGFGGEHIVRRGCWDYPLRPEEYAELRGREPAGPGYYARGGS
jgi:lipid II:glycine glycyltransferase (peptidoglycan interpeptide bridge formation enzyme)